MPRVRGDAPRARLAARGSRPVGRRDPEARSSRTGGCTRGDPLIEQLAAAPAVGQDYRPYALTAAGDAVAFEWYRDGDWQIFVQSLPDGEPIRVGNLADRCGCPQFSPDGRSLYFTCDDRGSECYDIYRYDVDSGRGGQPAPRHAGPRAPARPRPLAGRRPAGDDRLPRRRLRRRRHAGAAEPGRRRAPLPHRAPVHGVLAALVARRDAPGGHDRHPRPGHGRRRHRRGVRRDALARRLGRVLRRPARLVAGRPPPRLRRRPRRPPGDRHLRAGDRVHHLGVGGPPRRRAPPGVGAGRRRARVPRRRGGRDRPLPHRPARRGRDRVQHRPRQPLRAELHAGRRRPPLRPQPPRRPARPVPRRAGRRRRDRAHRLAAGRSCGRLRSSPAARCGSPAGTTSPRCPASSSSRTSPTGPPSSSCTAARPGTTPTSGTRCGRPSWPPASPSLHPNYRGSDGYGRRWQLANRWLMGQGEVLDVAAAHEFLVELGCDPARIAITGRSWGGFHTMAAVTQFPDLWAAGVAGVPFFDFIDSQLDPTIREDLRWWDRENTGDIEKDRARLEYYSPINHLARVEAPLLLLGGALDPRCPPRQIAEVAERPARPRPRLRLRRLPRRGPRDQRPRAPRRLRPAHRRLHPGAHRLRLSGERRRPAATTRRSQRCEIR